MSSGYTLGVYVTQPDGSLTREVVDATWRMPYHVADSWAGELNGRYQGRSYFALNVNDPLVSSLHSHPRP